MTTLDALQPRRGGSWFVRPWGCRSVFRALARPGDAGGDVGFRVVCTTWRKPVRGGSIYGSTTALRSATRGFTPMALDTSIMGFRVAYLPPEVTP